MQIKKRTNQESKWVFDINLNWDAVVVNLLFTGSESNALAD